MNEPVAAVSGTHLNEPTWRSWKAVFTSWQLCALAQWTLHINILESRIHKQHTRGAVLRSIAPSQSTESPLSQCMRKRKAPKTSQKYYPEEMHIYSLLMKYPERKFSRLAGASHAAWFDRLDWRHVRKGPICVCVCVCMCVRAPRVQKETSDCQFCAPNTRSGPPSLWQRLIDRQCNNVTFLNS